MSLTKQGHSVLRAAPLREILLRSVPRNINTLYSPVIAPSFVEREHYLAPNSMRRPKIEHNLSKRDPTRLYWTFVTDTCKPQLPLSTMRMHFKRRWNNAFAAALKQNGLDFHGRVRPEVEGIGLKGTLEIRLFGAPNWEDKDTVQMFRHSDNIVQGLLSMQRQSEEGGFGYGYGYNPRNRDGNWKRYGSGNWSYRKV